MRGPSGLPGLDDITADIRDDGLLRTASPGRPPTAQDIAKQIWGALHFIPGIDGVADPGRTAGINGPLEPGDAMRRDMRDTQPPFWMDYPQAAQHWRQDYEGKAVRLRIKCTRSSYEPWHLFKDVVITPAPEAAGR
ncbi:hypothetical protein [Streptomyces sp. NPDC000410]|uniref:hypothetical protein n=1 Tax=Streptomyces sp. NPDC000410 TaxID=3154254 RepID=UPI003319F18E